MSHAPPRNQGEQPLAAAMDIVPTEPVVVPHTELAEDLLKAVVESFVLREGTDYGEVEFALDEKVARVIRQLERGEARIIFDPDTQSVDIAVSGAAARRRACRD